MFMSTSLYFKILMIRNKISSPEIFKLTRFDCIYRVFTALTFVFDRPGSEVIKLFYAQLS